MSPSKEHESAAASKSIQRGKTVSQKTILAAPKRTKKSAPAEGEVPAPPLRLRTRLSTIGDVKLELARLYRETRAKKVATQDASRMANMLLILGRLIEGSDLEARLDALEAQQRKESKTWSTQH